MNARGVTDQPAEPLELIQDGEPMRLWLEPLPKSEMANDAAGLLTMLLTAALGIGAATVAATLITTFGSLTAVLAAHGHRLSIVPGMSNAAVQLIKSAYAIAVVTAHEKIPDRDLLGSHAALAEYVRVKLRCQSVEAAYGLYLDRKNYLISEVLLGQGTVDHVPLYPREVVRHAIILDASALILVHNHPSGDPTPSPADIDITNEVASALATINVALYDHYIVGNNRITSLRTLGHLRS